MILKKGEVWLVKYKDSGNRLIELYILDISPSKKYIKYRLKNYSDDEWIEYANIFSLFEFIEKVVSTQRSSK